MSKVHIVFGKQGAGKSTYAKKLSKEENGIYISIDEWMWKLYGEDLPSSSNFSWIMKRVERCEKLILSTTEKIAKAGSAVILDLGFTKKAKRDLFVQLSNDEKISTQLHYVSAPHSFRRKRVLERNVEKGDTFSFEVTPGMFDFMEGEFQNPTEEELEQSVLIDTNE